MATDVQKYMFCNAAFESRRPTSYRFEFRIEFVHFRQNFDVFSNLRCNGQSQTKGRFWLPWIKQSTVILASVREQSSNTIKLYEKNYQLKTKRASKQGAEGGALWAQSRLDFAWTDWAWRQAEFHPTQTSSPPLPTLSVLPTHLNLADFSRKL